LTCAIEGDVNSASMAAQHTAFRVIQEALSNAHRHAQASAVEVELMSDPNLLAVRVADDGRGIETLRRGESGRTWQGVGTSGMRTRVEELGGWFSISCKSAGTEITAWIPATEKLLQ
jgi:signal transduction histidine kinase